MIGETPRQEEEKDISIPGEFDVEQLKLKEERLAKEAEEIANETNPQRKERLQKQWEEESELAKKQRRIQENLGVQEKKAA